MERRLTTLSVSSCVSNTRSTRGCRMCAAILVTSLCAGVYVYVALLRHGRRRTALRPASRDSDTVTVIGGNWQSRRPEVDTGLVTTTTLDGKSQWATSLFGLNRYLDRTFAQRIGSAKVKSKSEVTTQCHEFAVRPSLA